MNKQFAEITKLMVSQNAYNHIFDNPKIVPLSKCSENPTDEQLFTDLRLLKQLDYLEALKT